MHLPSQVFSCTRRTEQDSVDFTSKVCTQRMILNNLFPQGLFAGRHILFGNQVSESKVWERLVCPVNSSGYFAVLCHYTKSESPDRSPPNSSWSSFHLFTACFRRRNAVLSSLMCSKRTSSRRFWTGKCIFPWQLLLFAQSTSMAVLTITYSKFQSTD